MFESGEEPEVTMGLGIMNELVVPCIPLLLVHDTERDLLAVEDMRNRWCSYLGQEMECESLKGAGAYQASEIFLENKSLRLLEHSSVPLPKVTMIIRPRLGSLV